jgi:hypothetical protein
MDSSLSTKLTALCEQASHEYDAKKLLELTTQINRLLEEQHRKKEPPRANGEPPNLRTA